MVKSVASEGAQSGMYACGHPRFQVVRIGSVTQDGCLRAAIDEKFRS